MIDFADRRLERLAASADAMRRAVGTSQARKLMARLNALRAVDCVVELFALPGRWHVLSGNWKGHLSADLDHPKRLLVRPQEPAPTDDDGGVDWAATTAITVVGIFDTH